ncbi:MAG: signal recognition particle-docking protein FtsY [Propioniciclava sp.]
MPVNLSDLIVVGIVVAVLVGAVVTVGIRVARTRSHREVERPSAPSLPVAAEPATAEEASVEQHGAAPEVDVPEAPGTRLARLRRRLASSNNVLARALGDLLSADRLDAEVWDDFEATLIGSDLGVGPATELVEKLRRELAIDGVTDPEAARSVLRRELVALADPSMDRALRTEGPDGLPGVVLVVGVNGTGKTTTIGKLSRLLVAEGNSVLLGAADTFRAAAADQLETWGNRVEVPTVRGPEGGDPASVAFEAVGAGIERGADVVLVDTAGRLHNKANLMEELGKIRRVIERKAPITECLLLIDATTGQNGLVQARVFNEVTEVTGIVLSKLDGSAKGGIVVQVQRELGVPVKFIGLGEGADDLAPFTADGFVDGLLGD